MNGVLASGSRFSGNYFEEDAASHNDINIYDVEDGAEIFIEKLSKEGYSEVRLVTSKSNMLRIVYGNYASETEAANSLRSLRNKSDYFEQSWVLEIKD